MTSSSSPIARRARRTCAAAMAAVALLAGCGSSDGGSAMSADDFTASYGTASDSFKTRMAAVQSDAKTAVQAQAPDAQARVFTEMQKITEDTLVRMEALRPPPDYADELDDVLQALTAQRDALRRVLVTAKGSDAGAVSTALQSYATALTTWQASAVRLDTALGRDPARAGPRA